MTNLCQKTKNVTCYKLLKPYYVAPTRCTNCLGVQLIKHLTKGVKI